MYTIGKYRGSDKMSDLICENYPMLLVMSRFGISLGIEDKTIKEVCENNDVDETTFLTIINLLISEDNILSEHDLSKISIDSLISYLRNSHDYFLNYKLPLIRRKLLEAIDLNNNTIALAIIRFYDEYVAEVRKHMAYEEEKAFPYVENLIKGIPQDRYNIDTYSKQHDQVEAKLSELKNIIIKYYPSKGSNELNEVLFDIFSCADDLASHNDIEDYLFIPCIRFKETHN